MTQSVFVFAGAGHRSLTRAPNDSGAQREKQLPLVERSEFRSFLLHPQKAKNYSIIKKHSEADGMDSQTIETFGTRPVDYEPAQLIKQPNRSTRPMVRRLAFVTLFAIQRKPQHLFAPGCGRDPFADRPRRVMADMLVVSAGQLSNPVPLIVNVVPGNGLLHWETSQRGTIGLVEFNKLLIVTDAKAASVAA